MAACVSGLIRLIGARVCTLGASLTGLSAPTIRVLHDLVSPRLVETSVHWLQAHGTGLTQSVKPSSSLATQQLLLGQVPL